MFRKGFYAVMLAGLMMTGAAQAGGAPPTPTMEESSGMVPEPPTCDIDTEKLYWDGSDWDCVGSGYAKGSIVNITSASKNCPAGTTARVNYQRQSTVTGTGISATYYLCIKN